MNNAFSFVRGIIVEPEQFAARAENSLPDLRGSLVVLLSFRAMLKAPAFLLGGLQCSDLPLNAEITSDDPLLALSHLATLVNHAVCAMAV